MEEQLLKPGALDPGIPKSPYYVRHTFKLMNRYQVTHEWPGIAGSCQYGGYFGKPPGLPIRLLDSNGDIYERDGHTFLKEDSRYTGKNYKDELMDRFVRSHIVVDKAGKSWEQGLKPMCNQVWVGTGLALTIWMMKSTPEELEPRLRAWAGNMPRQLGKEQVGNNLWTVQRVPMRSNGVWDVENWMLPIGDTGYMFMFVFSADKDRVAAQPAAHDRMYEIFHHLIESVRIEPIQP
ncbi:hypothetical protein TK5_23650 [Sideroxyarcus sp. TK5]